MGATIVCTLQRASGSLSQGFAEKCLFPSRPEGHLVQLSEGESQYSTEMGRVLVTVLVAMTKYLMRASETA